MPRISDADIAMIRDLANIRDVAAQLPDAHAGHGISFHEDRNVYWCFACAKGGDVIHFAQTARGTSWAETVQWLYGQVGLAAIP